MSTPDVDVIIPAPSSPSDLALLVARLPEGHRAIVVSDGSNSGIVDVVRESSAVLVIEPGRGFGASARAGLLVADAPVVALADVDGVIGAQELENLVAAILRGDADVALAARPSRSSVVGRVVDRARAALRIDSERPARGRSSRTATAPRAAWRSDLVALDVQDRGALWPAEMLARARDAGLRVVELAS